MTEESEKPESDVLKAIHDKLMELEDLQLVNKLDIINMKNELDKASLTGGPSHETTEQAEELARLIEKSDNLKKGEKLVKELEELKSTLGKGRLLDAGKARANLDAITGEIGILKEKVSGLERKRGVAPSGKIDDTGLDELRKRITKLESAKPEEPDLEAPTKTRKDVAEIKKTLSDLGKFPKAGIPKNIIDRISDIENISSDIESLRSQLDKQETIVSSLEKKGVPVPGPIPKELEERLNRLESGAGERHEGDVPEDMMDRVKMLEAAVAEDEGKPKTVIAKPAKALLDRLGKLEEHMTTLDAIKDRVGKADSEKRGKPGNVEELKNMLENIKATMLDQGKEILDLKSVEKGTQNLIDLDEMKNELDSIKSQMSVIEEKAVKVGMAPDALEELRRLKGEFPVEEYHELKKRMTAIEQELDKLAKLAGGLKPIELPKEGAHGLGPSKALAEKVKELEKLVGEGVSGKRFKSLEKRLEEMREWLPEYIANDIDHRIDDFRKELNTKVQEVNELKEEMIEHTIEQLLAQPGHVSKLLGDRIKKQLDGLEEKVNKLDNIVKPSGAKLTTLLRDFDEAKREMEKEKDVLKNMQENNKNETESLSIELKALNTRIDSFDKSVKGMESVGISDVMRDLEILKTKADWLESTIHKLDLTQIYQRMDEIEEMMHSQRGYSPHVIE